MKSKKSKIPLFIPNQPRTAWWAIDSGERDKIERQKQFDNQRKLVLNKR